MTIDKYDTSKSINQLLIRTDILPPYESNLIECCERACMKPLRDVTPAETTALLRNDAGALEVVVPHALELLRQNPTMFGRHLDGDLFASVLAVPVEYWQKHKDDWGLAYLFLSDLEGAVEEIWKVKDAFLSDFHQ